MDLAVVLKSGRLGLDGGVNPNPVDINDVILLNPAVNIATGNTPVAGIQITYGISGISYTQFLYQLASKNVTIAMIIIESSNPAQLTKTMILKKEDVNGRLTNVVLTPIKDPYQSSSVQAVVEHPFTVDMLTSLILKTVLLNSGNLTIYLYPSLQVDVSKAMVGENPIQEFSAPLVIKDTKVFMQK